MKNMRSLYSIYHIVKEGSRYIREDYIETKEFETDEQIMGYMGALKQATGEEYVAHLSMLLVKDNKWKGKKNGKQYREK